MKTKETSNYTHLQGALAIASFASGVLIACVCLFFIPPQGEISTSGISIVSELLILCGSMLGMKVSYDAKQMNFENRIEAKLKKESGEDDV